MYPEDDLRFVWFYALLSSFLSQFILSLDIWVREKHAKGKGMLERIDFALKATNVQNQITDMERCENQELFARENNDNGPILSRYKW